MIAYVVSMGQRQVSPLINKVKEKTKINLKKTIIKSLDWVNWEILQNIRKPTLPTKNNEIPQNKREKRKIDLAQKVHKFFYFFKFFLTI